MYNILFNYHAQPISPTERLKSHPQQLHIIRSGTLCVPVPTVLTNMSYDTEYLMGLHLKGLFTKSKPKEFKFEAYGIPLYEMICFHNKLKLIKWKLDKRARAIKMSRPRRD